MDLNLAKRRVAIIGSSRGIGFGIARGFHQEGSRVLVSGRDVASVQRAREALGGVDATSDILGFTGDLTQLHEMERLLACVQQAWGGLDVLVLSLGSGRSKTALMADGVEWERVLRLNLGAAAEMLRLAVPMLSGGKDPAVVTIGSIAGLESLDAPWAYGAAKAGLLHLTKQSARHLAAMGIRVNMVAPGNILFNGGTWDSRRQEDPAAVARLLEREVPQKRFGTVEEIASAAVFLASPVSGFTTGTCLVVDGGQSRH